MHCVAVRCRAVPLVRNEGFRSPRLERKVSQTRTRATHCQGSGCKGGGAYRAKKVTGQLVQGEGCIAVRCRQCIINASAAKGWSGYCCKPTEQHAREAGARERGAAHRGKMVPDQLVQGRGALRWGTASAY